MTMAKISYEAKIGSKQLEGFFTTETKTPEVVEVKEAQINALFFLVILKVTNIIQK